MASELRNRFTDTEMQIARETDLPELLTHLGYQVKRVGQLPHHRGDGQLCGSRTDAPGSATLKASAATRSLSYSISATSLFRRQ